MSSIGRVLLLLLALSESTLQYGCAKPLYHGEEKFLYYGEVVFASLRDGLHKKPLVAVPDIDQRTGEDIIAQEAIDEAPEVLFRVQDGYLVEVSVRPATSSLSAVPHSDAIASMMERDLPPFRILISSSEVEESAEAFGILNAMSSHALHESIAVFRLNVPLFLLDAHQKHYIRLDTFSRRTTLFEAAFWIPSRSDLERFGKPASIITGPTNASFGVRFEVLAHLDNSTPRLRLSLTAKRKPTIPPQVIRIFLYDTIKVTSPALVKLREGSTGEALLKNIRGFQDDNASTEFILKVSEGKVHPRGISVRDVFANVSSNLMRRLMQRDAPLREGRGPSQPLLNRFVLRVVCEFEEIQRQFREVFLLENFYEVTRKLRSMENENHDLLPMSWDDRLAMLTRPRDRRHLDGGKFVRVRLSYFERQDAIALLILQPFPIKNLQVHAVDGNNETVFLEEEHEVPYIPYYDTGTVPFGWHHVFVKNQTWVASDRLRITVYFDLRDDHPSESGHHDAEALSQSYYSDVQDDDDLELVSKLIPEYYKRSLKVHHHHALRGAHEAQRRFDLLWSWIRRHGGHFDSEQFLVFNSQRSHMKLLVLNEQANGNMSKWPNEAHVILSVPKELFITPEVVQSVSFIKRLVDSSQGWSEFAARYSSPQRSDLVSYRGTLEYYYNFRWKQVAMLALFTLTQAEHAYDGTKFHLWIETWPKLDAPGQPLFPLIHFDLLGKVLRRYNLEYFAALVVRRRELMEAMYRVLEGEWPWLAPHLVSLDEFVHRMSLVDSFALEGSGGSFLYIVPGLQFCLHQEQPTAKAVYNVSTQMFELSVHKRTAENSEVGCAERQQVVGPYQPNSGVRCEHIVSCDWGGGFHPVKQKSGRLTALEMLLRHGEVPIAAPGVVDITVIGKQGSGFGDRVFLLTADITSRGAVQKYVGEMHCSKWVAADQRNCSIRHLHDLMTRRKLSIPNSIFPVDGLEESQRMYLGRATSIVSRLIRGAHIVLQSHLNDLEVQLAAPHVVPSDDEGEF